MKKYLFLLLTLVFILCGCHGCSFIKERLGIKQTQEEQTQDETQMQEERKSEPIPVSPPHS